MPVLPMLLVNGCDGIGTGFSTTVPPHHPLDLVALLLHRLGPAAAPAGPSGSSSRRSGSSGAAAAAAAAASPPPLPQLAPWVRGFRGAIRPLELGLGGEEEEEEEDERAAAGESSYSLSAAAAGAGAGAGAGSRLRPRPVAFVSEGVATVSGADEVSGL